MAADEKGHQSLVGQPMDRVDGVLKVTGGARYAAELELPGLVHAVLVECPVARGTLTALDTRAAERAPGVLAVLTRKNVPPLPVPTTPPSGDSTPLLDWTLNYSGQVVAVVVASTLEQAEHAAALVKADVDAERPELDLEQRLDTGFVPNSSFRPGEQTRGNVEQGLSGAAVKIDAVYRTPTEHHNPMEPHATVAAWDGDRLTVYDATQGVTNTAQNLCELFGLAREDVRVVDPFVGGGFGCKGQSWPHTPLTALAAKVVKRPVKCALSRRQMFFTVGHRPQTRQANLLAARRDGTLVALRHDAHNQTSRLDEFLEPTGAAPSMLYACDNVSVRHHLVRLDLSPPTYMRAPGEASGNFGLETAMDELAVALVMDPVELRLKNHADVDPSTGHPFSSKSLKACYAKGAEAFGWAKRDPRPGVRREGHWLVGTGMATASYPANFRPAAACAVMYADGSVRVSCGTQDLGTGTYTILTQVAADAVGVPASKVRVELGDSRLPTAPTSGGSCSATSAGSAVLLACRTLRSRVLQYLTSDEGSPLFNVKATELETRDGVVSLRGDPSKKTSYADILGRWGKRQVEQEAFAEPGRERGRPFGAPQGTEPADKGKSAEYTMHGFGAQFCEVKVDVDLGTVRVTRWTSAFALGKVLNEKTLTSQLRGGIVWGLGMALEEETLVDPTTGRFVNTTLSEYHVPVNADVPPIEVLLVDEQDELVSPLGAKGAGEIGITGAVAAIGNAIFHATGQRLRDLPFTLEKVLGPQVT